MAHITPQTAFRLGKTFLWHHNALIPTKQFPQNIVGNISKVQGLEKILKYFLKKRRFFIVKANLKYCTLQSKYYLNILVMPKMKKSPKQHIKELFCNSFILWNYNFKNKNFMNICKKFIDERREKIFLFPKLNNYVQINKWIYRKITKGFSMFKYGICNNTKKYMKFKKDHLYFRQGLKKNLKYVVLQATLNNFFFFKKRLKRRLPQRFYKNRWLFIQYNLESYKKKKKFLKPKKLALKLEKLLYQKFKIKLLNVFEYLALKNMISLKTLQAQFWNRKYKNRRFHYHNYFDIINSFFIVGLINNTENLILTLIKLVLPRLQKKIKKFLYFLDNVVKSMPQIQNKFSCFRILLTGKIRGGTKRTNSMLVGYGVIPRNSLTVQINNNFFCYRHLYGAFGLKLILNKTIKVRKIKYLRLKKQWKNYSRKRVFRVAGF